MLFYAETTRFSKTVSNQYLCPFCAPFSTHSALSLGKFINYECWVEDPNNYLLLLKFSCFSKCTWDISQVWQGIAKAKILFYVGVNPSKKISRISKGSRVYVSIRKLKN